MKTILQALRLLLVLTVLTGVAYPLAVTAVARLAFPHRSSGSLVSQGGKPVGSALLAQKFEDERYFWPRPSANDYATVPSGASNLGPTSAALRKAITERREKYGVDAPVDMLTASASGLDPDISPEAAAQQVARVAAARHLPTERVAAMVREVTQPPQYGIFGEPRVNVLALNLWLDAIK
ncbi:MAG: potassium-transporting ATPase subunit KdpC [Chthoniobacteraceae bacterium]|nr:potassium-transporting ATPase subunit KdpC [Chthoniobacteraceae bacterium]